MALARGPRDLICSARECEAKAAHALEWSNPNIHTGRTKTWLSCSEHLPQLMNYLTYRSFPVAVSTLDEYLASSDPTSAD